MKLTDFLRGSSKARSISCMLGIFQAIILLILIAVGIAFESRSAFVALVAFTFVISTLNIILKRLDKPDNNDISQKRTPILNLQDPTDD